VRTHPQRENKRTVQRKVDVTSHPPTPYPTHKMAEQSVEMSLLPPSGPEQRRGKEPRSATPTGEPGTPSSAHTTHSVDPSQHRKRNFVHWIRDQLSKPTVRVFMALFVVASVSFFPAVFTNPKDLDVIQWFSVDDTDAGTVGSSNAVGQSGSSI
jgi:hypothetical protein